MDVKERMIAIRLMEKLQAKPAYGKELGIAASLEHKQSACDGKRYKKQ